MHRQVRRMDREPWWICVPSSDWITKSCSNEIKLCPKKKHVIDKAHLKRVAALPCCAYRAIGLPRRYGTVVAYHNHMTGAGMAMKADDRDTMPLCEHHHTGQKVAIRSAAMRGRSGSGARKIM